MRRAVMAAALVLAALPATAHGHPLGNFSINHVAQVSVSRDRVDVRYLLDKAEIPTFQERGLTGREVVSRARGEVARGLVLTVDGARVPLVLQPGGELTRRTGQGGLETTRVAIDLRAAVRSPRTVALHDGTYPGRVGWKAIQPVPGRGTAVVASVGAGDPTRGLTVYPRALLSAPADVRDARLRVGEGAGTVTGPDGRRTAMAVRRSDGDGFARLLGDAAAGGTALVVLLLTAFGWGALHALSPGHGKGMVAAYLVGTRGRPRDAVALGVTVTVTHTVGVFALGAVTLALSAYVLPEDLYPWLRLASGVLVLGVGVGVLRARVRARRRHHHHDHHHHDHAGDRRGVLAMGASAGLIPCPTALVVLLGAIAQHEVALGLVLILAFSAGLAATLAVLGVLVVTAARLPRPGRLTTALPALSAAAIVGVGIVLTAQAIPGLVG
jgi:ABC-type nickel/cobalt efflux system permease component RcnA